MASETVILLSAGGIAGLVLMGVAAVAYSVEHRRRVALYDLVRDECPACDATTDLAPTTCEHCGFGSHDAQADLFRELKGAASAIAEAIEQYDRANRGSFSTSQRARDLIANAQRSTEVGMDAGLHTLDMLRDRAPRLLEGAPDVVGDGKVMLRSMANRIDHARQGLRGEITQGDGEGM